MNNKYYYVIIKNIPKISKELFTNTEIKGQYCTAVNNITKKDQKVRKLWNKLVTKTNTDIIPIIVEVVGNNEVRDMITSVAFFQDENDDKKTNYIRVKLVRPAKSSEVVKYLKSLDNDEKVKYKSLIMKLKYDIAVEYQLDKERRKKEAIEENESEEYIRKYKKDNWV